VGSGCSRRSFLDPFLEALTDDQQNRCARESLARSVEARLDEQGQEIRRAASTMRWRQRGHLLSATPRFLAGTSTVQDARNLPVAAVSRWPTAGSHEERVSGQATWMCQLSGGEIARPTVAGRPKAATHEHDHPLWGSPARKCHRRSYNALAARPILTQSLSTNFTAQSCSFAFGGSL